MISGGAPGGRNGCLPSCCWQGWRLVCQGTCSLSSPAAKILPKRPICLWFGFSFFISPCSSPSPPKHSKLLLSSSRILLLVVITLWQCSHIREQESEIALPFILGYLQVFPLTFIPSSFLQSLCNSRLFFHLEKPDIVEDLKSEMSLTWLPCLLVKLQSFLC